MSVSLTRRSKVLLALIASMTLGCSLLLGMHPRPLDPTPTAQNGDNPDSASPPLAGINKDQTGATTASERPADGGAALSTPAPLPAATPIPVIAVVAVPTTPAWQRIVVHETGDAETGRTVAELDNHYRKQFGGCIYHFVIRPDGKIEESAIWKDKKLAPAELEGNLSGEKAIHIALVGQFDRTSPTEKQLQKVREKIKELAAQYRISDAKVDVQPKVNCPGKMFPLRYPF